MVTTAAPARVVRVDGSHLHALTEFYREVWDRTATVSAVQQMFDVKKLGVAQVRGRTEPIRVYEVVGRKAGRR